jgi:phosphoserine phosphatase
MKSDPALVMTVIAGPGAEPQLVDSAAAIADALALRAAPDWLAAGRACDLALQGSDAASAEAAARRVIGGAAIDVLVQPAAGRRKRVFVADLEATMIENEMLDELADFVGRRAQVSEITRRAMNGEIDFATSLTERVALLRGLPQAALDEAAQRIRPMPGAHALLATLRAAGVWTALVTGGFAVFAERVAAELGFDQIVANRLDLVEGRIAGTITAPIVEREAKRDALVALARRAGVPLRATLAVGDGANDLPMLEAAGLGVAFRAKPTVAALSRWRIDHADLTALLYVQGYREAEIVAA